MHRADPVKEEGYLKFGLNIWVTDKNLQVRCASGRTIYAYINMNVQVKSIHI